MNPQYLGLPLIIYRSNLKKIPYRLNYCEEALVSGVVVPQGGSDVPGSLVFFSAHVLRYNSVLTHSQSPRFVVVVLILHLVEFGTILVLILYHRSRRTQPSFLQKVHLPLIGSIDFWLVTEVAHEAVPVVGM